MSKIKKFFKTLKDYIAYPFNAVTIARIDKKLRKIAEEDRNSLINEKDIEFLKGIGVNYPIPPKTEKQTAKCDKIC